MRRKEKNCNNDVEESKRMKATLMRLREREREREKEREREREKERERERERHNNGEISRTYEAS